MNDKMSRTDAEWIEAVAMQSADYTEEIRSLRAQLDEALKREAALRAAPKNRRKL